MTILLAGCAGFIGARVGEMLLQRGDRVVGVDNLNDYYDVRIKQYRLHRLATTHGFEFHKVDIEDSAAMSKLFATIPFDAVINLAARAGVRASIASPKIYLTTNALGTLNLLELMVAHGVRRFVMASTSSLYAGAQMPFSETTDVTRPISPYAATKLAAEALAHTWHHLHGLHVAILRYFTVYGPAGRPDMSPFRFIEWIRRGEQIHLFGDGSQTRDFTYVDDIAKGTVAALNIEGCEIFNLGGGMKPSSILSMIGIIEGALAATAQIKYLPGNKADMPDTSADISKAAKLLGWQPEINLRNGLRSAVAWHKSNSKLLDRVTL
jgi:UDP-glucuronate 4-epimerase